MPVALPFRVVFATTAVAVACSVCLLTLLKRALRSECPAQPPGGSSLRPVAIACTVTAAICIVASVACLVKSRAVSWAQAAAICSKWQPVYFVIVSLQRLTLTAIVAYAASAGARRTGSCSLESEYEYAVHSTSLMWSCAVLTTALLVMCCDTETELSPVLRRSAYGLLALVLLLDVIGSVVWGNPFAIDVSFSFTESFSILLDNQLTSSVASQVAIALHFVYVSFRSRRGCGWAYASLRFELDECGQSMLMPT